MSSRSLSSVLLQHSTAQHSTSHSTILQPEHEHEHASRAARQLQPSMAQPPLGPSQLKQSSLAISCQVQTVQTGNSPLPLPRLPLTGPQPLIPRKGSPQSEAARDPKKRDGRTLMGSEHRVLQSAIAQCAGRLQCSHSPTLICPVSKNSSKLHELSPFPWGPSRLLQSN
jgi:hypothetical protein